MTMCEMVCNQDLHSWTAKEFMIYLHTTDENNRLPGEPRVYLT